MFGTAAGFVALVLLVFDPNQLAHGAFVTTDTGLTCFLLASVYAFYRFVKRPTIWRLVLVGLAAGFALAAKHTGILVFPILLVLALCEWSLRRKAESSSEERRRLSIAQYVLSLAVVTVLSVTVLWASYGFRYAARPAGLQLNPASAEYIGSLSRPREAKLLATAAHYHLLPESYLYGLADVRLMDDFYSSFLLGKTYPHGVWFYFPLAIAIKSTLAFLILLGIAIWAVATRRLTRWREILFLTVPPVLYLAVAMSSHMNIGVRHVLPIYAFLEVLIGGTAVALARQRRWMYVFGALILFQIATSLRAAPTYISYVNEAWGGQKNAWWLLSDSNSDWAQQLKATKKYLDARGVKDCWFVYFGEGVIDTGYYGIPCKALPTADALWVDEKFYDTPASIDGMVLISAGDLSGFEFGPGELNPYEQFKTIKPTGVIQNGIYVFEGRFEIPLAAALGHRQKAEELLAQGKVDEALVEAQRAVALAPNAVAGNVALGDVLAALHRRDEARAAYEHALKAAQTIYPEFQVGAIPGIQKKLADTGS
jgi:hypothetical protein